MSEYSITVAIQKRLGGAQFSGFVCAITAAPPAVTIDNATVERWAIHVKTPTAPTARALDAPADWSVLTTDGAFVVQAAACMASGRAVKVLIAMEAVEDQGDRPAAAPA
jgi:hypothetical protein